MKRKTNRFWLERNLERFHRGEASLFLDPFMFHQIKKALKNRKYQVWEPFAESDYKIIYTSTFPEISCFSVECAQEMTHPMLMGSLYALNMDSGYIGDIVVGDACYFFVMSSLKDYMKQNLTMVGSFPIKLVEVDIDVLKSYERSYEHLEILVPSLRLDVILSKIAHTSRRMIKDKLLDEEVTLNYEMMKNGAVELKEKDVFSMRRCGKFRFIEVKGTTKKGNLVLVIHKF